MVCGVWYHSGMVWHAIVFCLWSGTLSETGFDGLIMTHIAQYYYICITWWYWVGNVIRIIGNIEISPKTQEVHLIDDSYHTIAVP